jgi:thermitase
MHPLAPAAPRLPNPLMIAALLAITYTGPASAQATDSEFAPGRVLVMARAGLPDAELARQFNAHGARGQRIGQTGLYILDVPRGSERSVLARLQHNPHFKFAELDQRVQPAAAANDPYLGSQWHLGKIGATTAWDATQGSAITIAILDSGVDASHPDLSGRLVSGWNFYGNNSDTSDGNGHGTGVAGAAAASTNNGIGVAAVAGQAKIMPVRVSDSSGYAYWSTVAQGITWAADRGARVANASFVGVAGSSTVQSAAQYMKNKGGLVVVSAGNNGVRESFSSTTSLIAVSATDSNDTKTSWSSYGSFVALAAPGLGIYSTTRGGGYASWWGTSVASPVVAGTIALMMAARPTLSSADIEKLLFSTAADLGASGRDEYYGHGRVNAAAAVQAVLGASGTDTQAPGAHIGAPTAGSTVSGIASVDVTASDNVGVTKVELRVNGQVIATDSSAPYAFAWDTTKAASGSTQLVAVAYDAAGNAGSSAAVTVTVANSSSTPISADTLAPSVAITNPTAGSRLSGSSITVKVSATDNSGSSGIANTLHINGRLVASSTGASLSYKWNLRRLAVGTHTLQATSKDAAGNSRSMSIQVSR